DTTNIDITKFIAFKRDVDQHNVALIASNVKDHKDYETYLDAGFDFFSGPFYLINEAVESEEIDENYQQTLNLLNTLEQSSVIDDIVAEFTKAPEISYALLQYLNSPIFNMSKAVKSMRHALMLIGQKNLRKWLLMIAFSQVSTTSNSANPLLFSVQTRSQLMYQIASLSYETHHIQAEEASFVGVLSLLDHLIGVSKTTLFEAIFVAQNIKDAVMFEKGILGNMLALSVAIENFDTKKITQLSEVLHLSDSQINEVLTYGYTTR
ncbi:MAG TPA: HDOD domain-containing protein, partial [Helicobacteraceae bacterium]|nr:HDOD domain-containing protein [Helicobacteraceae bacterium]